MEATSMRWKLISKGTPWAPPAFVARG
jgi:hypothetical protein